MEGTTKREQHRGSACTCVSGKSESEELFGGGIVGGCGRDREKEGARMTAAASKEVRVSKRERAGEKEEEKDVARGHVCWRKKAGEC